MRKFKERSLKATARACPPVNGIKKEDNVPVNVPVNLSEIQRRALEIIESNPNITHRELAALMTVTEKTAKRTTKALRERGLLGSVP